MLDHFAKALDATSGSSNHNDFADNAVGNSSHSRTRLPVRWMSLVLSATRFHDATIYIVLAALSS
jgi:hypothetical protein